MIHMTSPDVSQPWWGTSTVADALRMNRRQVLRLDRGELDYWETPGGHRRFVPADVVRYAREIMGLDLAQA